MSAISHTVMGPAGPVRCVHPDPDSLQRCSNEAIMPVLEPLRTSWNDSHDAVKHPSHYTSHPSGIECWDITRHMNFNLGNAFKYIWRCDLKGKPIEDLEKAVECLQDEIAMRKKAASDE